nr:uncharacterized protein LOC106044396 [Anser cygnoides]
MPGHGKPEIFGTGSPWGQRQARWGCMGSTHGAGVSARARRSTEAGADRAEGKRKTSARCTRSIPGRAAGCAFPRPCKLCSEGKIPADLTQKVSAAPCHAGLRLSRAAGAPGSCPEPPLPVAWARRGPRAAEAPRDGEHGQHQQPRADGPGRTRSRQGDLLAKKRSRSFARLCAQQGGGCSPSPQRDAWSGRCSAPSPAPSGDQPGGATSPFIGKVGADGEDQTHLCGPGFLAFRNQIFELA